MTIPAAVVEKLQSQGIEPDTYDFAPGSRLWKTIARRLTEAARDTPHFTLTLHVHAAALLEFRSRLNDEFGADRKISVNDLIVVASASTLLLHPGVNSSFTDEGVVAHNRVDVSFAVATAKGLVTPIVRQAARLPLDQLGKLTRDLAERAANMRLLPTEYVGGGFCVSNLGMFGISQFTSIINPPHSAILSVGAIETRVVPVNGKPGMAPMMTLTLSCDHRVVDGAAGARFLADLRAVLEEPERITAGRD